MTAAVLFTASCSGGDGVATPPLTPVPAPVPALTDAAASPSSIALGTGQSQTLAISATTAPGATVAIAVVSSAPSVATVSGGAGQYTITAVSPGTTTLTATVSATGAGLTAASRTLQVPVTVTAAPAIATLTVTPAAPVLTVGQQVTLVPSVASASSAVSVAYEFRSASTAVASVNATGVVAALAPGTSDITVTARGSGGGFAATELTATARVSVSPGALTLTIEPATLSLPRGLAAQAAAVLRDGAGTVVSGEPVQWRSSDTSVARVDAGGLVVSGRPGTAVVEATSRGVVGSAAVTVSAPPPNAACRLPVRLGSVSFGFPRAASRLRSTGTVRATVLFVDFSDAPATRTPQSVLDIIQPTAGAYFTAQSYGAMQLVLEPSLRWLRMSKPSTQYGWPGAVTFEAHRALLQEAADLAAPTTDMSAADLLIVMTNPDAGAISFGPAFVPGTGGGIRVPGRTTTIDNATNSGRDLTFWGGLWLAHEMGHLLSLPDLYDYLPPTPAQLHLHVGEWSLMGQINGRGAELSAFERWQLGWLADEQLVCAPAATSLVALSPITRAGGTKAAIVPLGATTALVVESRRALGFDARIPQTGALAYLIDTQVASGRGTMRVLPTDDTDLVKLTRVLSPGQSVTLGGATITLVARSDSTDVVRVVRP
jgi:M6 family metalloprotease-like protein